jgi:hypothetical protein
MVNSSIFKIATSKIESNSTILFNNIKIRVTPFLIQWSLFEWSNSPNSDTDSTFWDTKLFLNSHERKKNTCILQRITDNIYHSSCQNYTRLCVHLNGRAFKFTQWCISMLISFLWRACVRCMCIPCESFFPALDNVSYACCTPELSAELTVTRAYWRKQNPLCAAKFRCRKHYGACSRAVALDHLFAG